ncbi:MAG TPA: insulinase family protein [Anaerolineae bacterium]|nr:insulinase family protein [Anaerolineae bacterium]
MNQVVTKTLPNGLTVILAERRAAPVASFWLWYRVGSRNETPGLTGLSHWVEHMLFKGTKTHPQGDFDRMIQREGGQFNGMTWVDWTTFYATLPADRIGLALAIEADRMQNALFDPDEVESERTVIISEREGNENRPGYMLREQVQAASFLCHPYGHMVIGWKDDLRRITRDDLYAHYRAYYTPNNAVAVAVGDFRAEAMAARIEEAFGSIPPGPEPPPMRVTEPKPRAERRIQLHGPGGANYLLIAFQSLSAHDPDFFPLAVLTAVLDGARGLPPFGGSGLGRAARLHRALVNTGLALSVNASVAATLDSYLFTLSATVRPEQDRAEVEQRILEELARLQEEPVREDELARAIKGTRAMFAYGSESISNQAMWLGFAEMVADLDWLASYQDRLAAVTPEAIQRVTRRLFQPENRVIGWYVAS